MIIDTHSHCYWDSILPRIDDVVDTMKQHGITHAVQIGCDTKSSIQAIELAKKFPEVFFATVGIHPETSQDMTFQEIDTMMKELEVLISEHRDVIVGVGECGLDRHYLTPGKEELQKSSQQYSLVAHSLLAKKNNLPVIIHTRDAREETLSALQDADIRFAVMHCYSEDFELAQRLLDFSPDFYFSFSGILTYKNTLEIQETARKLPLDRILIETDAPFLAPQAVRGSINEPANTRFVLEKLIEIRTEGREMIEKAVYENSKRFYAIK